MATSGGPSCDKFHPLTFQTKHWWVRGGVTELRCDYCRETITTGVTELWNCTICRDYDLCGTCAEELCPAGRRRGAADEDAEEAADDDAETADVSREDYERVLQQLQEMQEANEKLQQDLDKAKKRKGRGDGRSSSPSPKRARGAAAKGKRRRADSEDFEFDDEESEPGDDGGAAAFETEDSESDTEGVSKAWVNRVQKYTAQIEKQLKHRSDIRFEIISRLICHMSVPDRELLRKTHAFHQERYLEAKRVLQLLQQHLFTAHNSLEARLECFLPVSAIRFLRDRKSVV